MRSSTSQPEPSSNTESEGEEAALNETSSRHALAAPATFARPGLIRSPPARLASLTSGEQDDGDDDTPKATASAPSPRVNAKTNIFQVEEAVAEGKAAVAEENAREVNAKLMLQQRMRTSYGNKRPSPIKEEGAESPKTLVTALSNSSGMTTASSLSTESTESGKTVRGSVPATPAGANLPIRTPSYPFPYVPGTPRTWSSAFHQPFTTLSPTTMGRLGSDADTPGHGSIASMVSGESTPAATTGIFMPPGMQQQILEDPRFPSPNLYHLVLQLNAEPGIESWWAAVTQIMHEHFKAERVTLAMPADPTDIENVPWGQKATFNMNGPEEFVPGPAGPEPGSVKPQTQKRDFSVPETDAVNDLRPQKLHPERLRPRLEARHSYAGHLRDAKEQLAETKPETRPRGPQRTVTHASGLPTVVGPSRFPARRLPSSVSVQQHGSITDPEFSSVAGGIDAGPFIDVFPVLKALDHEAHPLVETGGISRVLERGRVVTVTRDYASDLSSEDQDSTPSDRSADQHTRRSSKASQIFGNYRHVLASENAPDVRRDYEEYEQYPTSPWAQSPAPSPAVQADEDTNPFFASEEQQLEESFNPTTTPKDYSQFGQVEAIGVDRSCTVLHVPLVHPTLSQPMQSLRFSDSKKDQAPQRSETLDSERRAPIAILSILTPTVPYPANLVQSLKLLGPHLATSLSMSQQFSSGHLLNMTLRHRRSASGRNMDVAPMTIEPATLDDIVRANVDDLSGSVEGSITSPSDYSGRSRHSPGSSIAGTPGWDPAAHGWTASKSVAGTPALLGSDMVDNYFDAKKRNVQRSGSSAGTSVQNTPARQSKRQPGHDSKPQLDSDVLKADRKARVAIAKDDPASPRTRSGATAEPPPSSQRPSIRQNLSNVPETLEKRHSLLHSYGADFQSSFGAMTAVTPSETRKPTGASHARKLSYAEEMPPPSERLLRTIIDSLPVQIFTAEPETGKLTWVNSKFLIYRGQDSRQVLSEPWQAIHPEDRQVYMETWDRSLRTGQQLQQKVRLQRFDGSYRWFYVRAAPLKDKRQNIVHWIGTNMDFHEQQIAENNLAKQQETAASEAKYRALANSSPQIVFAVNRTKGITFCNSQWVNYSGQKEAQALGVGFMDHVHPEDLAKCKLPSFGDGKEKPTNVPISMPPEPRRTTSMMSATESSSGSSDTARGSDPDSSPSQPMPQRKLSELASTGILKVTRDDDGRPSYSTEVRLKHKDGVFRWHLVRVLLAQPLLQSGDAEETWYGTCTDINDHKTLERDLKETMDEKSRFLSNMSHEIRTPLNGITGMVNFLIDSNLSAEQMEHVNIIRASTEGLRGLINDILDLSKAEAGMIQLNIEWMHVRALIEEVNDLTSTMAIDKGLELNYIVDENVPPQVKGDRFRLRQILLNVIGNAIKFTQEGEVFVRCSVQQDVDQELSKGEIFIRFEVVDTGSGFNDREAEALFKRFSQIDGSSTRQHGGTGLGLVISRQLAQLHGGDMSAKGSPGKGSTFTFFIRTTLPSATDQPPSATTSVSATSIPILPMPSHLLATPGPTPPVAPPTLSRIPSIPSVVEGRAKPSPKFVPEHTTSPLYYGSPDAGRESPSVSSISSDPSMHSAARTSSIRSERSSASSYYPEPSLPTTSTMKLTMPRTSSSQSLSTSSADSTSTLKPRTSHDSAESTPSGALTPPMFSILVIAPLKYSREATIQHIDKTLPSNVPHQITARESLMDCQRMFGGSDPVVFSHVVAVLQDVSEIVALLDQLLSTPAHSATTIVIISDFAQKKKIMDIAPQFDYKKLADDQRVLFIFKPLKPSRFAAIFDPQKGREMSTDRNQDSAQQVALSQKQVFEELTKRLGNKDKRVLLVEDNRVNQMVILKFFSKIAIKVETVMDGVQCTDKVFAQEPGYYHTILCDLHMPNKDGYQTCKEIRKWEKKNKYSHIPIIALSANVLGDVYQKCVDAGFNSYITKPVDFKELSKVLMTFMDPSDPSKPHEFMKKKREGR